MTATCQRWRETWIFAGYQNAITCMAGCYQQDIDLVERRKRARFRAARPPET